MPALRRREFIALLGGAAAWPLTAHAQQSERMRRIGVITGVLESDTDAQARSAVLRRALQQLGWTEGRNIQFYERSGSAGDSDLVRRNAQELVALGPDLIVAAGSQNVAALQQASRIVPILTSGGLISYGPDPIDQARRAAGYVHRILKGEKPGELPVQSPTKYD